MMLLAIKSILLGRKSIHYEHTELTVVLLFKLRKSQRWRFEHFVESVRQMVKQNKKWMGNKMQTTASFLLETGEQMAEIYIWRRVMGEQKGNKVNYVNGSI